MGGTTRIGIKGSQVAWKGVDGVPGHIPGHLSSLAVWKGVGGVPDTSWASFFIGGMKGVGGVPDSSWASFFIGPIPGQSPILVCLPHLMLPLRAPNACLGVARSLACEVGPQLL
ncbi:hypothetical protein NDU88_007936 [Pleurodeles waltl]|uniref:Uncharacterized protein n=1 Tax=Pleurodeles waltl TaxID=8319 RepID=A0AAV7QN98_PLEWA|nr:hypothetical protein NDU88_007936 [Pleurodeles waltl]